MNIVRISAGLGNQMFQYALYLALRQVNGDSNVAIDVTEFKYRKHHHGYELEKIFNISPRVASTSEIETLADTSKSFWAGVRRDILKISRTTHGTLYKETGFSFLPDVFTMHDTYLQGFWQSWKYFDLVEEEVLSQFSFKTPLSSKNQECADAINAVESVSIHIRRGDYVKKRRWDEIGSICSMEYYNWAIAHIKEQIDNPKFFIFSDDAQWARKNLILDNATIVDWNNGVESYNDMRLMSMCKHNIIANSSFSWWGANLNKNLDKIVIAPSRWYRSTPTPDLLPIGWITLPID